MTSTVNRAAEPPSAGRRRQSIRDVAELAGVSVGTVSNVLNHPTLVAETTRARVEDAIRELGFVRNGPARQLRAGTSRTVGAIVLDIANPFFTDVARGIEDRLAEDDYVLVLASSDEKREKEQRYLRLLEEQGVHGALVCPAEDDLTWLEPARIRGTSVVLLDRTSPSPDMCSVAVDDVTGGELAANHLLTQGHRRIGNVCGPDKIRSCADRSEGVRKALRAAGHQLSDALVEVTVSSTNADGGEAALEDLLALHEPVTAIVCVNDLVALGVIRGLRRHGLRVPEDVAVVGYDDVEFAAVLSTPLTSVRQPRYEIGRVAAGLLLAEGDRDHQHEQIWFQPELVIRESSGPHTSPHRPSTPRARAAPA